MAKKKQTPKKGKKTTTPQGQAHQAIADAVDDERLACAEVICRVCREDGPPSFFKTDRDTIHIFHPVSCKTGETDDFIASVYCRAAPIWGRDLELSGE